MAILGDREFFNYTRTTMGKVVRGRKKNDKYEIPQSAAMAAIYVILQRIYPSERQSAEWEYVL